MNQFLLTLDHGGLVYFQVATLTITVIWITTIYQWAMMISCRGVLQLDVGSKTHKGEGQWKHMEELCLVQLVLNLTTTAMEGKKTLLRPFSKNGERNSD